MTLEELEKSNCILFKTICGSKAYGLDNEHSDTDIKGVFILPRAKYYSLEYTSQINDEKNDVVYYELNKFVELALKNNPNILELLSMPEDSILFKHPLFDRFQLSDFLSKKCEKSFANYAFAQIKKARGLNKKIVNPISEIRKGVLDFCFVYSGKKTQSLNSFLKGKEINQNECGLVKITNFKNCFSLYRNPTIPYKGIVKNEKSNDIALSSVPKEEEPIAILTFHMESYSTYCKQYKEYWEWTKKRNEERYASNVQHGKNYDSKNMMHTIRLLKMAEEIATEGTLNVRRADREYLLSVKKGNFEYEELVELAESKKNELSTLFSESRLPEEPDKEYIETVMREIRIEFYK
ncbi:MAG: DNA polymerase beta superfamily protein [Flavobacteriales bacterium]